MAYCRFGDSDVYMYHHVSGYIECCACSIAPKAISIFTTGLEADDPRAKIFGDQEPCEECNGEGCDSCMVAGSMTFNTRSRAVKHLKEHIEKGDNVSKDAISRIEEEILEFGDLLEVYCKKDN